MASRACRRELVRIAGMHRRTLRAFLCARIAVIESGHIQISRQLSTYLWSGGPAEVKTVAVAIPRSLRAYFPNGLRVLA